MPKQIIDVQLNLNKKDHRILIQFNNSNNPKKLKAFRKMFYLFGQFKIGKYYTFSKRLIVRDRLTKYTRNQDGKTKANSWRGDYFKQCFCEIAIIINAN